MGHGIHRGIRIYAAKLETDEMIAESSSPLSTTSGSAFLWYLNMNPTPDDISDKSGNGHDPVWVSGARPALWRRGDVDILAPAAPENLRVE